MKCPLKFGSLYGTAATAAPEEKNMTARANPMDRPMTPEETAVLYEWTGEEDDCPDDLYVNAGNQPIIIGAQAQIPYDSGKIMPGDRVLGSYYGEVAGLPMFTGLMPLKKIPMARRVELERLRKLRTGDEPQPWVKEAWSKLSEEDRKKIEKATGGGK